MTEKEKGDEEHRKPSTEQSSDRRLLESVAETNTAPDPALGGLNQTSKYWRTSSKGQVLCTEPAYTSANPDRHHDRIPEFQLYILHSNSTYFIVYTKISHTASLPHRRSPWRADPRLVSTPGNPAWDQRCDGSGQVGGTINQGNICVWPASIVIVIIVQIPFLELAPKRIPGSHSPAGEVRFPLSLFVGTPLFLFQLLVVRFTANHLLGVLAEL